MFWASEQETGRGGREAFVDCLSAARGNSQIGGEGVGGRVSSRWAAVLFTPTRTTPVMSVTCRDGPA
jgi:hypothetical protein